MATDTDGEIGLNARPFVEHTRINCPSNGYIHVITEDPVDSGLDIENTYTTI